jgi:signal peptidase
MTRHAAARGATVHGWTAQVLAWLVIVAVVALLAVAVLVPRAIGATPYTVLTSSMEPSMPAGTLVVVKPVDVGDISVGDVVTYQLESGRSAVVTHRVVATAVTMAGEQVFTTRGDANDSPDADPVRPVQIRGERVYFVPHVGRLTALVDPVQRDLAQTVIVVGLLGYAALMFAGAVRERRPVPLAPAVARDTDGATP